MPLDVIVIGAGAAGLLAATAAAERGRHVLLLEKNQRPGVKILMSGGTRCNLTQATDKWGIVKAFGGQGPFLHSALACLDPDQLVQLIECEGVPTKVEETGKVFPASNRASDVLDGLLRRLRRSGAELALSEAVIGLRRLPEGLLVDTPNRSLTASAVVLTTGGQSYPGCGTTGDGYGWAKQLGHTLAQPRPALVPLKSNATWVRQLKGVTVDDAKVTAVFGQGNAHSGEDRPRQRPSPGNVASRKEMRTAHRGALLFTHFGLSGPAILDISRAFTGSAVPRESQVACDFLPGETEDEVAKSLGSGLTVVGKRQLTSVLSERLPRRLVEQLVNNAQIPQDRRLAELGRRERIEIVRQLKDTHIDVQGTLGFRKAEVTAGGILLDEVDSRSMQSKITPGLFLAGEILDLDGPIGGYNFQAAFSTGWLAGQSV